MGAVQPLPAQLLGPSFYSLLEYFDQVKTNRTGSADFPGNGVDADAINAKAAYHDNVKQAAMQRLDHGKVLETLPRKIKAKEMSSCLGVGPGNAHVLAGPCRLRKHSRPQHRNQPGFLFCAGNRIDLFDGFNHDQP